MFFGANIIVLDLEAARSADDCRHCGKSYESHYAEGACEPWRGMKPADYITQWSRIGWDNKLALGLSIGCYFDYADGQLHWFDTYTLEAMVQLFVEGQPLLVSFNGIQHDFALMQALIRDKAAWYAAPEGGVDTQESERLTRLCDTFKTLCTSSYDILQQIWTVDSARKFERGLNSLDALCKAMGLPAKEMDGAAAPRLWAAGHYAEVVQYNANDVLRTKALFEHLMGQGYVVRGDGQPLQIHPPLAMPDLERCGTLRPQTCALGVP